MAISTQQSLLVPLVFKAFLLILLLNMVKSKQSPLLSSDSVAFTFPNFLSPDVSNTITFQGDARVTAGDLQLSKIDSSGQPATQSRGRAVYSNPVHLWDRKTNRLATWYTSFNFILKTVQNKPADGLAFFIAPTNSNVKDPGGCLGLFNKDFPTDPTKNQVVAVEFDTWPNTEWPEPTYKHIGIDVNSVVSVATKKWEDRDIFSESVATAQISYDGYTKILTVVLTYPNGGDYVLTRQVDFTTLLPEYVIVGFSAATGVEYEKHFIQSWHFSSTL